MVGVGRSRGRKKQEGRGERGDRNGLRIRKKKREGKEKIDTLGWDHGC